MSILGALYKCSTFAYLPLYGVSAFTPRSIHISNSTFTRSPLAACYWPQPSHSLAAVHYGTRTAAILNVHRFVIKSSLFTGKWVG